MTVAEDKPRVPLFEDFSIEQLARLTGYSEEYLKDLKRRPHRIREGFRSRVSRILSIDEAELFQPKEER